MLTLVKLIPLLVQLIQAAESLMPSPGQGSTKFSLVLATLESILKAVPSTAGQVSTIISAAGPLVSTIVATFNALGHFTAGAKVSSAVGAAATAAAGLATADTSIPSGNAGGA